MVNYNIKRHNVWTKLLQVKEILFQWILFDWMQSKWFWNYLFQNPFDCIPIINNLDEDNRWDELMFLIILLISFIMSKIYENSTLWFSPVYVKLQLLFFFSSKYSFSCSFPVPYIYFLFIILRLRIHPNNKQRDKSPNSPLTPWINTQAHCKTVRHWILVQTNDNVISGSLLLCVCAQ